MYLLFIHICTPCVWISFFWESKQLNIFRFCQIPRFLHFQNSIRTIWCDVTVVMLLLLLNFLCTGLRRFTCINFIQLSYFLYNYFESPCEFQFPNVRCFFGTPCIGLPWLTGLRLLMPSYKVLSNIVQRLRIVRLQADKTHWLNSWVPWRNITKANRCDSDDSYVISCENDSSLVTSYWAADLDGMTCQGPQKFWAHGLREAKDDEADDKEDADDKDKARARDQSDRHIIHPWCFFNLFKNVYRFYALYMHINPAVARSVISAQLADTFPLYLLASRGPLAIVVQDHSPLASLSIYSTSLLSALLTFSPFYPLQLPHFPLSPPLYPLHWLLTLAISVHPSLVLNFHLRLPRRSFSFKRVDHWGPSSALYLSIPEEIDHLDSSTSFSLCHCRLRPNRRALTLAASW